MGVGEASRGGSEGAIVGGRREWSDPAPHPVRRWIARGFDFHVTTGLVFMGLALPWMGLGGAAAFELPAAVLSVVYLLTPARGIACAVLNALLLSRFSTTPGKWLCGVRIAHKDGTRLTFGQALTRELDAFAMGCGVYIPLLGALANGVHFFDLRKTGTTPWDRARDLCVDQRPNSASQFILALIAFLLAAIVVFAIFLAAVTLEDARRAGAR